jgi:hypothetical protein
MRQHDGGVAAADHGFGLAGTRPVAGPELNSSAAGGLPQVPPAPLGEPAGIDGGRATRRQVLTRAANRA